MELFNTVQSRITAFLVVMLLAASALNTVYISISLEGFADENAKRTETSTYAHRKAELHNLVSVGYTTVQRFYDESQDVDKLKERKRAELKKIVDAVHSQAMAVYQKNRDSMDEAELRSTIADLVSGVRYDGDNYLWINDMDAVMIMHPIKPALDGKDLSGFTDPAGNALFAEMVEVCREHDEGVVDYMWAKPGESEPKPKISYVRKLPGLDWVLGTGAWLEDIESQMQAEALKAVKEMRLPDGGYFWINDDAEPVPSMVMHPTAPSLDGQPLDDPKYDCATAYRQGLDGRLVETDGSMNLFVAMVRAVQGEGAGFVTYLWPKPRPEGGVTEARYPKLSFVQRFEPWGWIIGMGVYTDDIAASVNMERQFFHDHIVATLVKTSAANLAAALLVAVLFLAIFRRDVNTPLAKLTRFAEEVDGGDLEARIDGRFIGSLQDLKTALERMQGSIRHGIRCSDESAEQAKRETQKAEGTLARVQDHVGQLNQLLDRMNDVAHTAGDVSKTMTAKADELADQFATVIAGAEEQRNSLGETMAGMNEVRSAVENVSRNAAEAAETSETARTTANSGAGVVGEAAAAIAQMRDATEALKRSMGELGEQAQAIGQVMNVINDIADQTNLLALNAAIEAARAGEAGRGFAVVADEVRKLAEKTMDATREVGDTIQAIQLSAKDNIERVDASALAADKAADKADRSGATLEEIVALVSGNAARVNGISSAAEEQTAATEAMSRNIERVNDIAAQTVADMNAATRFTAELTELAEKTRTVIASLKE